MYPVVVKGGLLTASQGIELDVAAVLIPEKSRLYKAPPERASRTTSTSYKEMGLKEDVQKTLVSWSRTESKLVRSKLDEPPVLSVEIC